MTSSILKKFILALSVIFLISCDSDFNELGSDIIQDDIHHDNMTRYVAGAVAYDRATGPVQANNLPLNSLGIYNNPAFGKTTAHFVTQLELASENPEFGADVVIDTVYLYVPYFSNLVSTDGETGVNTYTLDSIYGNADAKMKLSVLENRFFLRDSDPGTSFISGQKYYSDDWDMINAQAGQQINTDANLAENNEFTFSPSEIKRERVVDGETVVIERFAPGIYMNLDKTFFANKIMNAPAGKLTNNNLFREYFRGIYFKVEQTSDQGAMAMAAFDKGKIVIIYHEDETSSSTPPTVERVRKTLTLNMNGNTVNFFNNEYNGAFTSALTTTDQTFGDERLYVKGGAGSLAFIDILSAADIEALQADRVLINEANLTFYIDQSAMPSGTVEPLRLYLYDVNNKRPIYDYFTDITTNSVNPKYAKTTHNGLIQRDSDGKGVRYRIRLTDHINNIINKDSTNVRLGLAVTESINLIGNASLKTLITETALVPLGSVLSPMGTILYGTNPAVPDDKRLKLEIFYTKPN